ncbi:uncharacterized protein [Ptychodera flava]|uniref:uncharacterized protein n=1 Tax=Ptychodera flava TaxID=63121 RepID=UPI00396A517C
MFSSLFAVLFVSKISFSTAQDVGVKSFDITIPTLPLDTSHCTAATPYTFDITLCEISGKEATVTKVEVYYTDNINYEDAIDKTVPVEADLGGTPIVVPADGEDTSAALTANMLAYDPCSFSHICVVTTADNDDYYANDDACIPLDGGTTSTSNCPPKHLEEIRSLHFADKRNRDNSDEPTVKFDLHVCHFGGGSGSITDVKFYYMDTDTYDAASSKHSPEHSTKLTAEVDADGDHTFSDQEVELTDDDKCEDYSYLCAFIVVTDDTDNGNDYSCIKLDLSEISTFNCPDVSAEEFKVTSPDPEEISYTPEENTDIEFEIKAGAEIEDGTISGVEIYFTDNEDFYADDVIKSEKFEATEVDPKAITEDNDVDVKGKASVKPDEEQCALYTHMCGKLIVTSTDTITDNNVQCIPTDEENAGEIDCGDSAAAVVGVGKYSVLASVIFVLASYLF